MASEKLTDQQVEAEIARLQGSPYVKLAAKERRVRQRRRMYLYHLRQQDMKGRELAKSGFTLENLEQLIRDTEECEED